MSTNVLIFKVKETAPEFVCYSVEYNKLDTINARKNRKVLYERSPQGYKNYLQGLSSSLSDSNLLHINAFLDNDTFGDPLNTDLLVAWVLLPNVNGTCEYSWPDQKYTGTDLKSKPITTNINMSVSEQSKINGVSQLLQANYYRKVQQLYEIAFGDYGHPSFETAQLTAGFENTETASETITFPKNDSLGITDDCNITLRAGKELIPELRLQLRKNSILKNKIRVFKKLGENKLIFEFYPYRTEGSLEVTSADSNIGITSGGSIPNLKQDSIYGGNATIGQAQASLISRCKGRDAFAPWFLKASIIQKGQASKDQFIFDTNTSIEKESLTPVTLKMSDDDILNLWDRQKGHVDLFGMTGSYYITPIVIEAGSTGNIRTNSTVENSITSYTKFRT